MDEELDNPRMVRVVTSQVRKPCTRSSFAFGEMAPGVEDDTVRIYVIGTWVDTAEATGRHSQVGQQIIDAKSLSGKWRSWETSCSRRARARLGSALTLSCVAFRGQLLETSLFSYV